MVSKGTSKEVQAAAATTTPVDPKKKKNKLIRPRGKRGGIKKKHVKDEITGKWSRTNIPATKPKDKQDQKIQKPADTSIDQNGETLHAKHISNFHALQKRLASPATTPEERAEIEAQLSQLGGLKAYQDASLVGASAHGECGVWVGTSLLAHVPSLKGISSSGSSDTNSAGKKRKFRMLDVGAIRGTAYDRFGDWMEAVSIDLNPRSEKVFQADFLDCEVPPHRVVDEDDKDEAQDDGELEEEDAKEGAESSKVQQRSQKKKKQKGKQDADVSTAEATAPDSTSAFTPTPLPQSQVSAGFDVVSLSLVVNFEGDLQKRGEMLLRPHAFLRSQPVEKKGKEQGGGYLILILPLPCVTKSRYCSPEHLSDMLKSAGWTVIFRQDSKRLTRWLLREKPGVRRKGEIGCEGGGKGLRERWWDGRHFGRKEVVVGVRLNNFCIKLVGKDGAAEEEEQASIGDDSTEEEETPLRKEEAKSMSKGGKQKSKVKQTGKPEASNGAGKVTSSLHSSKKSSRSKSRQSA
ncbi:25S rRNA (adenine2142-N1)-methyltransferase [Tilletia horrida]|uniref:25S rRNA (Adenine2142-N1)-methyltransferase n=1 Tax=Tilletia horrida TaxID=155126 RepID=A0AAN6GTG1_9BASI|nr:25S rRNA (adenine2142-N1)-methyltransferase [Tilletia horrida]